MERSEPYEERAEPHGGRAGGPHEGHGGEPHDRPVGASRDRPVGEPYDAHAPRPFGGPSYDAHAPQAGPAPAPQPGPTAATATVRRRVFRHCFLPGKLIAGLVLAGTAGAYGGDAAGAWHTPAYLAVPLVLGGLLLAGGASWLSYRGRRRAARAASTENTAAPASTSGTQAMR